jgi:NTE family protein
MLVHSVAILQKTIIQAQMKIAPPDLYLDLDVGRFGALQFHLVNEILQAAEPAKETFRQELLRVLGGHAALTT